LSNLRRDSIAEPPHGDVSTVRGEAHTNEFPKPWTDEIVDAADVVITMGCGDARPSSPENAIKSGP
jgi:protein-tyrosine-phosphatase